MPPASFDIKTTIHDVMAQYGENATGKTYVITGPSIKSLGAAAALGLAKGNPKCLILVGRSLSKIQPVIDTIKNLNPSISTHFVSVDLLNLASVRSGAEQIKKITTEIHGLLNCAGIMAIEPYQTSADGIESQFACNHVSHFLLTNLLMDELAKASGVVVNVSSGGYELAEVNFEDVNFKNGKEYNSWAAYGQSKTANILFTTGLTQRVNKRGVVSFALNPGLVVETALQSNAGVTEDHFMRGFELFIKRNNGVIPHAPTEVSADQGAGCIVLSLIDPEFRASPGAWIHECQIESVKPYATDKESADKLWDMSEKLVKQEFKW